MQEPENGSTDPSQVCADTCGAKAGGLVIKVMPIVGPVCTDGEQGDAEERQKRQGTQPSLIPDMVEREHHDQAWDQRWV